jgi:nucleoid-associated protein YgaU
MSTLEKFGILVILILVVIIGVVAVWGVGGEGANPFAPGDADVAAVEDPATGTIPGAPPAAPEWPTSVPTAPAAAGTGAVAPPPVAVQPERPVPPPAPPAAAVRTYTVQKGDTLAKISQDMLGSSGRWKEIVAVNQGLDPRKLKIGQVLSIPTSGGATVAEGTGATGIPAPNTLRAPAEAAKTEKVPATNFKPNDADGPTDEAASGTRTVEVQKGDTFYSLASKYLGNSNYHYKIQSANPDIDPRRLKPGMKIKIPAQ